MLTVDRSDVLKSWQRVEASLEATRATKTLREAVRALEVIHGLGGTAGDMAGTAIARACEELEAQVALEPR